MSPGRGWVPQQRRFQLFRCLKLAPAERCGHVTERRQSAPACLRVPAPNARRPEERRRRAAAAGRAGKAAPGLEGRREGRGDARADGGQQPAPPRPGPPCLRGPLPSGTADATPPASYALGSLGPPPGSALAAPWGPARVSAPQTCGYVPLPAPGCGCLLPGPRRSLIPSTVAAPRRPSRGLTARRRREHRMR